MVSFRTALFAGCVTSLLSFVVASPVESDVGLVERAAQITHSGRVRDTTSIRRCRIPELTRYSYFLGYLVQSRPRCLRFRRW